MRFKIIFLVFLITLSFGCATKKPIDYNSAMEDTGSVELDADFNGAVDVDKGGTNVQTYSALKVVLSLDQVDNTADIDKPVSTLTQTEIDTKEDTLPVVSEDVSFLTSLINGVRSFLTIAETKTALSLNNVDNTSDANKPVSTLTQSALDLKADQSDLDTTNTAVGLNTAKVTEQDTGTNTGDQEGDGVTITGAGTSGDPFVSVATGTGDVVGPGSAVDSNLAAFDTTTGKLIKDALIAIANVFTLDGTQTVTGDKTFEGVVDATGATFSTGPINHGAGSATTPTADGEWRYNSGITGFVDKIFSYFTTARQYVIPVDSLPTTTGEQQTYNATTDKMEWVANGSGGGGITEVATSPDPWDMTPLTEYLALDNGERSILESDSSEVHRWLADTSTDLFELTLTVAETDGSTVDINGTSYGNGGPYTISALTGVTDMDITYVTADTTVFSGADSGDVTGTTPNFAIDMSLADKTLIATISSGGSAKDSSSVFYYSGDNAGGTLIAETYSSTLSGTLTVATVINTLSARNHTVGGAYYLQGSDTANVIDNISFPVTAENIVNSTEGYAEFWVYPTATTDDNMFFAMESGSDYMRAWIETDSTVKFYSNTSVLSTLTSSDTVNQGAMNHIEIRWLTSNDEIAIRINEGTWITKTNVVTSPFTSEPSTIEIGSVNNINGLFGSIDDIQIWRKYDKTY